MRQCKLLLLLLLVATIPVLAQPDKPSASTEKARAVAAETPKQNLSDDFAKAGLKALRAIERTLGKPSFEGGSIAVPRATQELIDNTDAEARADAEKAIVEALNKFYIARLTNNVERELMKPLSYNAESEIKAQTELEKDPRNIDLNSREAACSRALDDILRARQLTNKPLVCDEANPPKEGRQFCKPC